MIARLVFAACGASATIALAAPAEPPVAPRIPTIVHSPNGDRVDDYYWLRDDDPKSKRPEVMRYLEAENAWSDAWFAPLQPLRDRLVAEMRARIREDDSTPPVYDHGWWFWQRWEAGAEYPELLRRRGGPERPDPASPEEVLLDEAALVAGHPYYRLAASAQSPDGQWLAWTEDRTGRRIFTLRLKNLKTGRVLDEHVDGVLDSLVWANDSRTLFYVRQDPVTLQGDAVMRHRVGGGSADAEVWREKDRTLFYAIGSTASRRWLRIALEGFDTTEVLALPLDAPARRPRVVLARRPGIRAYADHADGRWVFRTNDGAPNFRLVEARRPASRAGWHDLVAARADATIEDFALLTGRVAVQERVRARTQVRLLGGPTIAADEAANVALGDNRDPAAAHLRYGVMSLVQPPATWDLHLADGARILRKERQVPTYDKTLYETARIWAPARDGARVPVTLAWRRDRARRDGTAPIVVEGYGSYGASLDPVFSSNRVSLLDRGFVWAIAHVRGGADLGESWYEAGRLMRKKNTFDDFVDVVDHLLAERWGARDKVFATGASAGGLLMGVVANEAGARFRGIALAVPFVDVVTTMLDDTIPLTANEWTQWGDPHDKAAYDYMLSYSPYDNIGAHDYPAMLVTTSLWDSQVQYYEPAKYVAKLRATKTDRNPLLLHVNMEAGHGGSSGRFRRLQEIALQYAFFIELAGKRD